MVLLAQAQSDDLMYLLLVCLGAFVSVAMFFHWLDGYKLRRDVGDK